MKRIAAYALAAALVPAAAGAQAPPDTQPPVRPPVEAGKPDPCAHARATVGQGGDIAVKNPKGRTLSDQLAQSKGVICPPPRVDEELTHPAPPGGAMPVIPPSAVTPDGAQPK